MKPELMDAVFNLMLAMAKAEAVPAQEPDDDETEHRPEFILCDEIWEILDEAGHGTPVLIHRKDAPTEVLIYNRYATQDENVRFMSHISEEIDKGHTVTVNGTDIFDLY